MKKISICIPCYEMRDRGVEFLESLLWSVVAQTYKNVEVVISDHSEDSKIEDSVQKFSQFFPVIYLKNVNDRGSIASNLNNAIDHASGDYVKFLLQDDYFIDNRSLEHELKNIGDFQWGLCSTVHWNEEVMYWHLIPEYTHTIYTGGNTIGSPSLLLCKKEACLKFDMNLVHIVDCDYYRMMYDKHGWPKTSKRITTVSRVWDGQHQRSSVNENMKSKEQIYINKKYSGPSK